MSSLAKLFAREPENDWRQDAACRGLDPELFFASDDIANKQERLEREMTAKAVCSRCDVRTACLGYALEARERYGIWGGLNPSERRALGRQGRSEPATERVS
jgi:WhiB family transcriptional regulator, redox-sensing transcriptional regulator